ncbi:MAG: DUF1598 domain-containing protein, partial [Armatimonadota bacterium]
LYFDPTIVCNPDLNDARGIMVGNLVDQLISGNTDLLVQEGGQRSLRAVSLSDILQQNSDTPDLGGLSRVLGFVRDRKSGEITLLGKTEPDAPGISLDVLSVALRTIWKRKATPAISLDPDGADVFGPQRVRLEGISPDCRASEFTRIMLEADYEMKRILLGEDRLDIEGYKCFAEFIAQDTREIPADYFRWWLYPKETSGASVYRASRGDLDVFFYDSDVRLLTETMKLVSFGLASTGKIDAIAEQASNAFTSFYGDIEKRKPIFRQLHGLFDVAKLAAILRAQDVSNDQLNSVANRPIQPVEIRDSYEGIGPRLISWQAEGAARFLFIGGGVQTRSPLQPGDFVTCKPDRNASTLDALTQPHEGIVLDITLDTPSIMPLDPKNVIQADADMEAMRALEDITADEPQKAIARLNRVLAKEPGHVRARTVRALAGMIQGYYAAAIRDMDIAIKTEPSQRAFRGRIRMTAGDRAAGLADIQAAAAAFPDLPDVMMHKTWADIQTLDLKQAALDLKRLKTMLPLDPEVERTGKQLRLVSAMDLKEARTFLKAQLAMPISVSVALSRALALSKQGNPSQATDVVSRILRSTEPKKGETDPLYIQERCWMLMAIINFDARTPESTTEARGHLVRLEKRRPNWPSMLYYHLLLDTKMPFQQAARMYLRAVKMPGTGDPMILEARLQEGRNLKAEVGFKLAMRTAAGTDRGITQSTIHSVFDQASADCPDGIARRVLALVRKSLDQTALEMKGKPSNGPEMERTDREFVSGLLSLPAAKGHPDAVNLIALKMLTSTLLKGGCRYASSTQEYTDASRLFAAISRGLASDWASAASLDEAAEETVTSHGMCADMLTRKVATDSSLLTDKTAYDSAKIDLSGLVDSIDQVAESLTDNQQDISPFSTALLRGSLFTRYSALLPDVDQAELNRLILLRQSQIAESIENSANGLVEMKAASLWFTNLSNLVPNLTDSELKQQLLIDFHRRYSRLAQRFRQESALH